MTGAVSLTLCFIILQWTNYHIFSFEPSEGIERARARGKSQTIALNDSSKGMFWFLQVTDIHVSERNYGNGYKNLEYFLKNTMPCINPLFVLATGDLTDARTGIFGTGQRPWEWEQYHQLLESSGVLKRENFWLDVRGNHDCFGVASWESENNLFARYSSTKTRQYFQIFDLDFGKYAIVAPDGCPDYGPSKPLNFFGVLSKRKMDWLEEVSQKLEAEDVNHTFVSFHYPLITTSFEHTTSGLDFNQLSTRFSAILSGHLHKLFGLGKRSLYSKSPSGLLDLELNDMKDSKAFRIMAVDNDIFSFVDETIDKPPFILITNPPDARFLTNSSRDTLTMLESSHVRVLVFSPITIKEAYFSIDESEELQLQESRDSKQLLVHPWNPKKLGSGIHKIRVRIVDAMGSARIIERSFSTGKTSLEINTLGGFLLSVRLQFWIRFWFLSTTIFLAASLMSSFVLVWILKTTGRWDRWRYEVIKEFRRRRQAEHWRAGDLLEGLHGCMVRLCVFSEGDPLFFALLFHSLLLLIGPFMIARLITNESGLSFIFAWGIWRPGVGWIQTFDTMFFVFFELFWQIIPGNLLLILLRSDSLLFGAVIRSPDEQTSPLTPVQPNPIGYGLTLRLPMLFWWLGCLVINLAITLTYGLSSFFFGFGNWWHFLLVTYGIATVLSRKIDLVPISPQSS